MDNDNNKRKKIIEIYKNNNLTNVEKQIEINKIMNPNSLIFKKKNNTENEEEIIIKSCSHYIRNCMIYANCCNKYYPCRLCHDEEEDHKINRYEIKTIICKECKTIQDSSNQCINCNIQFAEYFCNMTSVVFITSLLPIRRNAFSKSGFFTTRKELSTLPLTLHKAPRQFWLSVTFVMSEVI